MMLLAMFQTQQYPPPETDSRARTKTDVNKWNVARPDVPAQLLT
jgi:hypothetical protein